MEIGDVAPDAALRDQNDAEVRLSETVGPNGAVVFFYPRDGTPLCTREACAFRDGFEAFRGLGVAVVGVSSDAPAAHERFATRHRLPFTLLSDAGGGLRKAWGVAKTLGVAPGRVTYVVDAGLRVRNVFSSQFEPARHAAEALAAVKRMLNA